MKIKYEISKLHDGGSNYTIFLSHSNSDDTWEKLTAALKGEGIDIASDKEIKAGDPDFAICIKNMIRENEIMVMDVYDGRITPWMVYELGIAAGLNKKIILFSSTPVDENTNYLFKQYGPVIHDINVLVHEIKNSFFFSDLFEYETNGLSKSAFMGACMTNIDICRLSFRLSGIEEIPKSIYRFGYILLSVARYEKTENSNRLTNICNMTAEEITDGKCGIDSLPCSLCEKQCFESPTDVILNKILFNCSVDLTRQSLTLNLPFNRYRGVTFKCFVDVSNMDYVQDIMAILEKAGLYDIGLSHSMFGNRIYFMLPQSVINGLFAIEAPDGFINNYLCKGAIL